MEHTELPFHQEADRIKDNMGNHICYLQRPVGHTARAGMLISCERAELIVRACNCHKELVDMLKDIAKQIEDSEDWWMDVPDTGGFDLEKIEALIKKAT